MLEDAIVQLPGGRIRGFFSDDGHVFRARGVKYAKAKRFEISVPINNWEELLDCTKSAVIAPQLPSRLEAVMGPLTVGRAQHEDCLHVSIAAPAQLMGAEQQKVKAPVMVFFHGGAYITGGGDLECYEGTSLAARGVVVVNVTSRLGMLGYPMTEDIGAANLGLMDQILALKWVQQNISTFGGSPERVTVFGQSSGADSIYAMFLTDETRGLFHGAILQSAPMGWREIPHDQRQHVDCALGEVAAQIVGRLTLKTMPAQDLVTQVQSELIKAAADYPSGALPFSPSFGHHPLPPPDQVDVKIREFAHRNVPVLICCTKDEGTAFAALNKNLSPLFNLPFVGHPVFSLASWFFSKRIFHWASQRLTQQIVNAGGKAKMVYFSWSPPRTRWGAAHCIDLPFLLGQWSAWESAPMLEGENSKQVLERVGPEVQKLWVAFASGVDLSEKDIEINASFRYSL